MSKNYSILVPDDLHINQRNFPSFFKYIERESVNVKFVKERRDWISLYGNYQSKISVLNEKIKILMMMTEEDLFSYSVKGVNLFSVSRAEILSKVIVNEQWYSNEIPSNLEDIFHKLLRLNKYDLLQNLAAAWEWVNFWSSFLHDEKEFTHCCMFSGSLIYQKSLMELLKFKKTKVFVMESFFTGNDYYCEEKYEHIANNCDIKFDAIYNSLLSDLSDEEMDRERSKAINKVILSKNKNVTQPINGENILFDNNEKVIVILGQVVNDFSLLEYKNIGLSSILFYRQLIASLTNRGFNLVFKAHPWEEKKTNVNSAFTYNLILKFIEDFPLEQQAKIKVVSDYPIEKLFSIADFVVGLNSQSLLEASFHGLKPIQFGDAFFGKKGFTHDYSLNEIEQFSQDLKENKLDGRLDLSQYRFFEDFMTKLLQGQLVSIHNSGISKLISILNLPDMINLVSRKANNLAPVVANDAVVSYEKELKKKDEAKVKEDGFELVKSKEINRHPQEKIVVPGTNSQRKVRKFKKDPRKFFSDSKNPLIRPLRFFFKSKG